MIWPGSARSSTSASSSAAWAAPVLPIDRGEVVGERLGPGADGRGRRAGTARPCRPVTITWSRSSAVEAGRLQRVGRRPRRPAARRRARRSAPPTGARPRRPGVRQRSRNSPVAVPPPMVSAMTPGPSPNSEGRGRVAAVRLVGAAGQAGADVAQHGQAAARRRPGVHATTFERTEPTRVVGAGRGRQAERGVDGGGVRLVEVGGRGRGRRSGRGRPAPAGAERRAIRAASTPIDVVSSS